MKLLNLKQLKNESPGRRCTNSITLAIKKIFRSKRGFTIMETIVSLLILSILLTTIFTIIRFSTSLTSDSIIRAKESQDRFNALVLEDYDELPESALSTITFTSDDAEIEASHDVIVYDVDGVVAFAPAS